jgi:hypothetical protein
MTPTILLRLAAVLAIIQGTAHGALFFTAKPTHGPAEVAVVDAMKATVFTVAGAPRSYWVYYVGYALLAIAICYVEGVLLWQLARTAGANVELARPMVVTLLVFNLLHALIMARFFFPLPAIFDGLVAATLGAALIVMARNS